MNEIDKYCCSYAVFCGDYFICNVTHRTEIPQVLSIYEEKAIKEKAYNSKGYEDCEFIGYGFLTIKFNNIIL